MFTVHHPLSTTQSGSRTKWQHRRKFGSVPCTTASSCSASKKANRRSAGIIIPDTAKEKPQQGKVIAVGKGKIEKDGKVTPLDVKEGDTILFGKYSGQEIKLDGEEYLIMREEEILGVINK